MVALCGREPVNSPESLRLLLGDAGGQLYYKEMEHLPVDLERLKQSLKRYCGSRVRVWLELCANCGLCAASCPFYLSQGDPRNIPGYKIRVLTQMLRRPGRIDTPFMLRAMDVAFGACTRCSRCAVYCPMGIDVGELMGITRQVLFEQGFVPWEMKLGSGMHRVYGAQMDVTGEEWRETCAWIEEEQEGLSIPMERHGADTLYVLNAREAKFYPQDIAAAALLFQLAGESWTVAESGWDGTSLSWFAGDREGFVRNVERVYATVDRLAPRRVVGTECGHAYRATVVEGPYLAGRADGQPPVPFLHYVEWLAEALRKGTLRLDPAKRIKEPVTIQDPCNVVRNGGLGQALREVVHALAEDVREMPETCDHAFCCGGGGGLNGIGRYREARNAALSVKADQIRATGASLVVVSCHNCWDALRDLLVLESMQGVRRALLKPLVVQSLAQPDEITLGGLMDIQP